MDQISNQISGYTRTLDNYIIGASRNQIASGVLLVVAHACLVYYIIALVPSISPSVEKVINNPFFKIAVLALILISSRISPSIAILLSIAFIVTTNKLVKNVYWENLENGSDTATAVQAAGNVISAQIENTPIVSSVVEPSGTITITPQITSDGTVVNPTIVVAPAVVSTPEGQVVTITPNVHTLSVDSNEHGVKLAPIDFPVTERTVASTEECYPTRQVDMSTVTGLSKDL